MKSHVCRLFFASLLSASLCGKPAFADSGLSKTSESKKAQREFELIQLVDIALTRNPKTQFAWAQSRAAIAEVGAAKAAYFPQVTLTGELGYLDFGEADFPGFKDIDVSSYGPGVELSYLLLDFGGREANVNMMRARLKAANFARDQVLQDVILLVQQAYYDAASAKALLELAEAQVELARVEVDSQQLAVEAGLAVPTRALKADKSLAEAQRDLQAARSQYATTLGMVNVACGAPANAALAIAPLPNMADSPRFEKDASKLIRIALARRPELGQLLAQVEAKEQAVRQVESSYWPTVTLDAEWENSWYNARGNNSLFTTPVRESGAEHTLGATLTIEWELFDGFYRVNKARAAREEAKASMAEFAGARLDVSQEVWSGYYMFLTAGRDLDFRKAGLQAAQSRYDLVSEGLTAGLFDLIDFYQANVVLSQAKADEIAARAQWFGATAKLLFAAGQLSADNVPR